MWSGDYNELDEFRGALTEPTGSTTETTVVEVLTPGSLDTLLLTVAQLQALSGIAAGSQRLVWDATFGTGIYRFSTDATATSAPTYYRADDDSGVWTKQT